MNLQSQNWPQTIWKFPIKSIGNDALEMPLGASVLTVQVQNEIPVIWARVDPEQPKVRRRVWIAVTGGRIELPVIEDSDYIGTFQLHDGRFVGHVFLGRER